MIVDFLTGFAVYFIIWWLVLFTVLPWGMRSAHEEGAEVEAGNDRAAPVRVNMWRKFVITTLVALVVYGLYYWLTIHSGFSLDDIPFMPELPKV
jgi:predicted secreted protein